MYVLQSSVFTLFHILTLFTFNIYYLCIIFLNTQISKLENLKNMRCMSISDAIDPVARMFFFAVLLEVCKLPDIHFQTLLQPMAALEHLQNKPHFVKCLQSIQQLQHLDISRTVQHIPNKVSSVQPGIVEDNKNICITGYVSH